jgi:hypothetical protein
MIGPQADGTFRIPNIDYDPEKHRYSVEGADFVSVTTVTRMLSNWPSGNDYNMTRGSAVHSACEFDDLGDLNESTVDPVILPYLEAYRQFKTDHDCLWTNIETPMVNLANKYAGRPDRIGVVDRKRCIVDLKTGGMFPSYAIQMAAYCHLTSEPYAHARIVVNLTEDGSYTMTSFGLETLQRHFNVFLSALNIYRFKKENGLL